MASEVSVQEVADAMYKMIKDAQGMKKFKAGDLTKAMRDVYGDAADRKTCKAAIKELIDSGRCVYTYFGGSFIEIPHDEGAANK
ncbi:MAG: hypothetical protein GF307_08475 [candidate division Zixibacteria bacterium]|nr:hypothetical protein [candidate division Zixibacteria bacterium]